MLLLRTVQQLHCVKGRQGHDLTLDNVCSTKEGEQLANELVSELSWTWLLGQDFNVSCLHNSYVINKTRQSLQACKSVVEM